jgi:hypothetical protein
MLEAVVGNFDEQNNALSSQNLMAGDRVGRAIIFMALQKVL